MGSKSNKSNVTTLFKTSNKSLINQKSNRPLAASGSCHGRNGRCPTQWVRHCWWPGFHELHVLLGWKCWKEGLNKNGFLQDLQDFAASAWKTKFVLEYCFLFFVSSFIGVVFWVCMSVGKFPMCLPRCFGGRSKAESLGTFSLVLVVGAPAVRVSQNLIVL